MISEYDYEQGIVGRPRAIRRMDTLKRKYGQETVRYPWVEGDVPQAIPEPEPVGVQAPEPKLIRPESLPVVLKWKPAPKSETTKADSKAKRSPPVPKRKRHWSAGSWSSRYYGKAKREKCFARRLEVERVVDIGHYQFRCAVVVYSHYPPCGTTVAISTTSSSTSTISRLA